MISPLWERELTADERAALGAPGPPTLPERPDVLVVGGGVVGLATAVMCRRAGLGEVLVVERGRLGGGASGGAAGLLSPDPHRIANLPELVALGDQSLALYRRLEAEWGPLGLHAVDLRLESGELLRDQAHVNPLRLAARLAAHAGTVMTGVEMTDLDVEHGRVVRARTTRGDLRPGVLVLATGLAEKWLPSVRQHQVKGHMLATDPAPFRLPVVALGLSGALQQLPDGRLLYGGTLDLGDDSPKVRGEVVATMRAELAQLAPGAERLATAYSWCCFRPATGDGLPVIDRVPGVANAWASIGHYRSGILLGAGAGRAIASWIVTGARPNEIEPFSATRQPSDRR